MTLLRESSPHRHFSILFNPAQTGPARIHPVRQTKQYDTRWLATVFHRRCSAIALLSSPYASLMSTTDSNHTRRPSKATPRGSARPMVLAGLVLLCITILLAVVICRENGLQDKAGLADDPIPAQDSKSTIPPAEPVEPVRTVSGPSSTPASASKNPESLPPDDLPLPVPEDAHGPTPFYVIENRSPHRVGEDGLDPDDRSPEVDRDSPVRDIGPVLPDPLEDAPTNLTDPGQASGGSSPTDEAPAPD